MWLSRTLLHLIMSELADARSTSAPPPPSPPHPNPRAYANKEGQSSAVAPRLTLLAGCLRWFVCVALIRCSLAVNGEREVDQPPACVCSKCSELKALGRRGVGVLGSGGPERLAVLPLPFRTTDPSASDRLRAIGARRHFFVWPCEAPVGGPGGPIPLRSPRRLSEITRPVPPLPPALQWLDVMVDPKSTTLTDQRGFDSPEGSITLSTTQAHHHNRHSPGRVFDRLHHVPPPPPQTYANGEQPLGPGHSSVGTIPGEM